MSKAKNKKALRLLDAWMTDKSGYDKTVYPIIEQSLSEKECLTDNLPKIQVTSRLTIDDISLIVNGAYAPLTGFMTKEQYRQVIEHTSMPYNTPWTMPITLAVAKEDVPHYVDRVNLYDGDTFLAKMRVTDVYEYDKRREARIVYRTEDENHPGVARLYQQGDRLIGGDIVVEREQLEKGNAPIRIREEFRVRGWKTIVAFQTRNPMHRAHEYITKCALEMCDGLFIHPLVGELKADDVPQSVRMECYQTLIENYYPYNRVAFAGLPMGMRYAGPREAVHHAIVRKNFGCTHFIVGRDAAGVGNYYKPYEAWDLFDRIGDLGITPLFFYDAFYCKKCGQMATEKTCPHRSEEHVTLSGTQVRQMLKNGESLPPEITRSEVYEVLKGDY